MPGFAFEWVRKKGWREGVGMCVCVCAWAKHAQANQAGTGYSRTYA